MAEIDTKDVERLKALVEAHQVCYEVWAEFLMVGGERRKVGFELQLFGVHDHPEEQVVAGCRHCSHTYKDLSQIAGWIMPKETRPSRYDVEPFDHSLREAPKRLRSLPFSREFRTQLSNLDLIRAYVSSPAILARYATAYATS